MLLQEVEVLEDFSVFSTQTQGLPGHPVHKPEHWQSPRNSNRSVRVVDQPPVAEREEDGIKLGPHGKRGRLLTAASKKAPERQAGGSHYPFSAISAL